MSQKEQNVDIFPSRILLAIGGPEEADLVTRKAVGLAYSTGSELHVVMSGCFPTS